MDISYLYGLKIFTKHFADVVFFYKYYFVLQKNYNLFAYI